MLFFRRFLNLFRARKLEREIEAELRAHIQMRTDDNLAAGMAPDDASRDAAVRFGNAGVINERTRGVEIEQVIDNVWRDLRYAIRQLRHSPGFCVTAVLTLSLAIAANVVVLGVLNSLLLRPVVAGEAGRLFMIAAKDEETQSYPDYADYREQNNTFSGIAAYRINRVGLTAGNSAYKCWILEASGNYFDLLNVRPALGRFFHMSDEHGPDSAPYVVLSDSFWRAHLGGDPRIIGTTVHVNQHPFTVIGVAQASFHGTEHFMWPDLWLPIVNEKQIEGFDFLTQRFNHGMYAIGLLKPGVTALQAEENLNVIASRLGKQYRVTDEGMKAVLVTPGLMGKQIGQAARAFLSAIMALALLVLLAACTNLAGIFAARSADRFRELAIRLAIGSSRWHVLRQLITETIVVSLLGGAVGTLLASVLLYILSRWHPFTEFPIHVTVDPSARVLIVAAFLSFASGIVPGLLPARQLWRTDLVQAIKAAAPQALVSRRLSLRDVLLAVQITLCALLLTSSFVALRGMGRSLHAPLGFNPHDVMLAETDMNMAGYADNALHAVQTQILREAVRIPGVEAAGIIDDPPLGTRGSTTSVYPPTATNFRPSDSPFGAKFYTISPGYLQAAGTRLLAGRDVGWHDDEKAAKVALVNETFAQKLFGKSYAVGRRFKTSKESDYEIIGIVEAGKYDTLTEDPTAAMFFPAAQGADSDTALVVRSKLPPAQIAAALNNMLTKLAPKLPFSIESWWQTMALILFPARVATVALGVMGLLAAMLAITGVFGMAAYSVSKRKKEFGIRIALGTQPLQLVRAALARPFVLLLTGSVAGLTLGVIASRLLGQIVYHATPRDPLVWTGVVVSMALLGLAATWVPARRALSVDAAKLLREDI